MDNLEFRVRAIEDRNIRVEKDKAWETSITRTVTIMILTYIIVTTAFFSLSLSSPFQNAFIPTIAFGISVQTLPWIKNLWLKRQSRS